MIHEMGTGRAVADVFDRVRAEPRGAPDRPWVMLNMVTSVDGATTVEGGSTGLSDDDDRVLFSALRAISDVILVGAGTVRAENYRPIRPTEQAGPRVELGQRPAPRLVIVSGSLGLDASARVFSDPDHRPTILTSDDADSDRIRSLSGVADVVALPVLDGASIVGALDGEGLVLCEGGPMLNGVLVADHQVDEVNWTVSPMLASGSSKPMIVGGEVSSPFDLVLDRVWRGDRSLFLRYLRGASKA